ncbi:hypothetical protein [Gracilimonas mengyeensis]|uniref:Uncharacterized protein n=1 Tax=Gracilimonas mengyeensis TaxID=1302730 RepID=A0A521ES78_9BACT|nr:hypothetical protein [Gracilimonas mengyeensis]SMO86752.1 hypothetical protein SAMN06265219_11388 [Gracilimonas mengyeensis]
MLIGKDFNDRAKELLSVLAEVSEGDIERKVSVEDLVNAAGFDRTEIKNLLGYLENKEYIRVATIGGPYLYGHIHITERGVYKSKT